jgi:hypothetical protein
MMAPPDSWLSPDVEDSFTLMMCFHRKRRFRK